MTLSRFAVAIVFALAASCQPRYPRIETLLITADTLPAGWYVLDGPSPPPSAPFGGIRSKERTEVFFDSTTAGAFEYIQRFGSREEAFPEYLDEKALVFREVKVDGPYEVPAELPYRSSIAEQYYFACVRPSYYPYPYLRCDYVAQYGPYVVTFQIDWRPNLMNATGLEKILRTVDAKMAPYAK